MIYGIWYSISWLVEGLSEAGDIYCCQIQSQTDIQRPMDSNRDSGFIGSKTSAVNLFWVPLLN